MIDHKWTNKLPEEEIVIQLTDAKVKYLELEDALRSKADMHNEVVQAYRDEVQRIYKEQRKLQALMVLIRKQCPHRFVARYEENANTTYVECKLCDTEGHLSVK